MCIMIAAKEDAKADRDRKHDSCLPPLRNNRQLWLQKRGQISLRDSVRGKRKYKMLASYL